MEIPVATPGGSAPATETCAVQQSKDKGKGISVEEDIIYIMNLKPQDLNKPLKLKVYRKWASRNVPDPNPTGLCFILLDKQGGAIQANVQLWDMKLFDAKLQVNSCYWIDAYGCKKTEKWQQTLENDMTLLFGKYTQIILESYETSGTSMNLVTQQPTGYPVGISKSRTSGIMGPMAPFLLPPPEVETQETEMPQQHMPIRALLEVKPETNVTLEILKVQETVLSWWGVNLVQMLTEKEASIHILFLTNKSNSSGILMCSNASNRPTCARCEYYINYRVDAPSNNPKTFKPFRMPFCSFQYNNRILPPFKNARIK
ncbi:nucleic acid-binding, OB-fold protein [Artemisia annua]|uniref:Nucleic acid-binding, OB-fold protein n=1 Tax=Artemisia annua TaxID=35608 RepID=A0A2U1L7Y2_ARTAN|nr:nucleic acid-binding, OB-fold protein [Artemisia annua]